MDVTEFEKRIEKDAGKVAKELHKRLMVLARQYAKRYNTVVWMPYARLLREVITRICA